MDVWPMGVKRSLKGKIIDESEETHRTNVIRWYMD